MENNLELIVNKYNLGDNKSFEIINSFKEHLEVIEQWRNKCLNIVIKSEEEKELMAEARIARLFLKDKRVLIEKKRKQLKEASLREGQAIDAIGKYLTSLIVPIEEHLLKQEKFIEEKEKEKLNELANNRYNELIKYNCYYNIDELKTISDDIYTSLLIGAKIKYEKELAEQKIKEEKANEIINENKKLVEEYNKLKNVAENSIPIINKNESIYDDEKEKEMLISFANKISNIKFENINNPKYSTIASNTKHLLKKVADYILNNV